MTSVLLCEAVKGFGAVDKTAETERTDIRFLTGLTVNDLCKDSPEGSRPVLLVSGLFFALWIGESLTAQLFWEDIFQGAGAEKTELVCLICPSPYRSFGFLGRTSCTL